MKVKAKRTAAERLRTRLKRRRRVSGKEGAGLLTSVTSAVGETAKHVLKNAARLAVGNVAGVVGDVAGVVGDAAGRVLNKGVDLLPFEVHVPGYQYCGPGTKLEKRLKRGDPGINPLDAACKDHDVAYAHSSETADRVIADKRLAERAWQRVLAKDSSAGEKATAWAVTNVMKAKAKLGGGSGVRRRRMKATRKRRKRSKASTALQRLKAMVGQGLYLRPYRKSGGGGRKKKHRRRRRR